MDITNVGDRSCSLRNISIEVGRRAWYCASTSKKSMHRDSNCVMKPVPKSASSGERKTVRFEAKFMEVSVVVQRSA